MKQVWKYVLILVVVLLALAVLLAGAGLLTGASLSRLGSGLTAHADSFRRSVEQSMDTLIRFSGF